MFVFALVVGLSLSAHAGEVARGELAILGLGLEVDRNPVVTAVDIPAVVQTIFAGKSNDEAPPAPELSAIGDLTGPGIDTPISLATMPGHAFRLPALHEKGEYTLQNIRLVGERGEFLQPAVPSFAVIQVADVLQTSVRVRQLTAAELRERGINVDSRNYEVYEYTFMFGVDQSTVEVPYSVIIDKRTRVIQPLIADPYRLPPLKFEKPPRFTPPQTQVFDLGQAGPLPPSSNDLDKTPPAPPSIPAALVIPNGFGVLHQFFAVILHVDNAAPEESEIRLDSVTATISAPLQMRIAKVLPAVSIGQPVPIFDEVTGATFLVAGAKGTAEWTLEALKAGTHTVNIEVNATYHKPGQEDFPLRGHVSTSLVVSDPRFHINFSHPETVRKDEPYTAYAFITNLSPQRQHVRLDTNDIPKCSSGGAFENICRTTGEGNYELDIEAGEMTSVPYALASKINGKVFAAAGSADDEALGVSVRLTMGVSATGIPLSPATLVMPYYTRFLPPELVDAQMRLLGLGHSLATAPLNKYTARLPRVIKTDVFTRAQQIARAGQRIFITNPAPNPDAFPHLALDLLGNTERVDQLAITPELAEWDALRRMEDAGRTAAAAMARELEKGYAAPRAFVDNFAAATSHRGPFMLAYVHGPPVGGSPRPYALSIAGVTSETLLDVHAEAGLGWTRTLPYGELTRFHLGGEAGELALVGRWNENLRVVVLPQTSSFTLHLLYPSQSDGAMLRADLDITGATVGARIVVELTRGARTLNVQYATGLATITDVAQTPLAVSAAAQDLYLDSTGHIVTLLLNRPVTLPAGVALRDHIALTINVPKANYTITRRNSAGAELQIPGAVIQQDGRIVSLTFDKTLSRNANYEIAVDSIVDLLTAVSFSRSGIVPRIDNDRPGAILTGRVLRADNTPVPGVLVQLLMKDLPVTAPDGTTTPRDVLQHDVAGADGRFLYEFVPRDLDSGIFGLYDLETESPEGLHASLSGAVRLPGEVHTANLVFLGRGRARGQVRYDDGTPIPNVTVSVGSTLHAGLFTDVTDAGGHYDIDGLPVAPLTFSVVDPDGRTTFAANHLRTSGEVLTQDLVVLRRESPGLGTVRLIVKRSDTGAPVAGATVGVSSQGYPLQDGETDANGRAEFRDVPAGLVTMLASAWSISRHSAAIELDLRADQTLEQTLVIQIADAAAKYATLEGTITRDDPASPNDASKDAIVPGAIVTVGNRPAVIAGADGAYAVLDLPVAPAGTSQGSVPVTVFDPATGRKGWFTLPTLVEGTNHFSMRLTSSQPDGVATMRVRLYGSHGEPVSNSRVFIPGYPTTRFTETATGVYELADVSVPRANTIFAVPVDTNGPYGEQVGQGQVRVDFHGQIGVTDVRLSGAGTIVVRLEVEGACGTCPPTQAIGPVAVTYSVWDDASQGMYAKTVEFQPDPSTGLVTLTKIPARQNLTIATVRNPAGYASTAAFLAYDGDVRNVTLRMKTIGDVTGRVLAHDGVTPVSGATVRILIGSATYSPVLTRPDGSFSFFAIPAATSFEIVAELNQDGLYRTGRVGGRTPTGGGPVSDLLITMREQSTVEGKVVDANGAIVPLARYWLRELEWPFRSIGTPRDPLFADINGRFIVANVFTGAFRITAVHPSNQEVRGDYQGSLAREGDASQRNVQVAIGGIGVGAISITVIDPLRGFVPVENAEVTLLRNENRFDFTTTNENGVAFFDQIPAAGTYRATAYSKALGRAGAGTGFGVVTGQTTSASVHLEFRGLVTGTLTDPEGEPANLPVKGMPVTLTGPLTTRDSTDENGAFEFDGVPEGAFTLFGYQIGSDRYAFGPAGLFISKLVPEQRNIHLELERTGTLTVKVYLPNDSGGPGELAPLADVTACQCVARFNDYSYLRGAQGNPVVFPKMLRRRGYDLTVVELGGEARTVKTSGSFAANEYAKEHVVVLPSSGTVEVMVVDGAGAPVADAQVRINDRTMYTPASGLVSIGGMPFGWITAQARKDNVAASAGGDLRSRTQPLRLTLNLGSSVSASGSVEAEAGGGAPSVRTRVVLTITSGLLPTPMRLETLTSSDGTYTFTGIPVGGTTLAFLFYGPDDTTAGASRVVDVPDGSTGTIAVPPVRLDATPPRVLSIDPPSNSTNVSPSTQITVTFSEPIAASFLTTQWLQLVATDTSAIVSVAFEASVRPDGTYIVKLTPPPPPAGQTFPLKSNVLYRFTIAPLQDTTGNPMPASVGSSFTTVNYTEPDIVRVDPSVDAPLFEGTTFRVKFNKPIDAQSGFAILERLDRHHGAPVAEIPVTRYVDPSDPSTLVVAPTGIAIAESSFYRLRIAEVHDTQTPANVQREQRVFDFSSFDTKKPIVTIVSPVETLVSGVLYSVTANVTDEGGAEASDVAYVDWLDANGVALARRTTKPYAYSFTAPATSTPTSLTLQASATDLSNNSSATHATMTWPVIPNDPPRDVVVTNAPSSIYPGAAVETRVRFADEGVAVSVVLELRGTNVDGSELRQFIGSQNATRASTSVPFPELTFRWSAPLALKDGTASIVATATDSVNRSGSGSGALTVLADTIPPVFLALAPKAETRYRYGVTSSYAIELSVRDDETAVERAIFTVNGGAVLNATTGTYDAATRVTTFRVTVPVPPKNADTRIPIVVTASDVRGNIRTETREVIYERVDDQSVPSAAWLTPLDGAALPSNQPGWLTTLRIRATDDQKVTSVRFESTALAAPITLTDPKSGTTDVFEAKAALTMPADGASFVIKAIVADGDPAHDVELAIAVDPVVAAPVVNADINISSITADQYANKSLLVRGARVYITVPLTLKELMLVDGAALSVSEETKLDLTITDRLFVDADSRIDVSGKGWLGGLARREDNSFTNPSRSGRTVGGAAGATNASASHAGIGGAYFGTTNATYGSITDPQDFGAGGAAQPDGSLTGGNGGGAMRIAGGAGLSRFVLAGSVFANGNSGGWASGAGGSIDLRARALIASPATRITANGADDDVLADLDMGGGGGRIALRIAERLDAQTAQLAARGGRNGAGAEGPQYVDGGAGTIYVAGPDGADAVIVSSRDERYPSSTHRAMGTPIGAIDAGSITIGPRALARFDVAPIVTPSADATATVVAPGAVPSIAIRSTTPAANGSVAQNTKIDALFDAASTVGIREVRAILDVQPADAVTYPQFAATLTGAAISANVPSSTSAGAASLRLFVRDRAGRTADTALVPFTVVTNAAPSIDAFDLAPATEIYAGNAIAVAAGASDDIAVQSINLSSSAGTVSANAASKPTPTTMARTFSVALPPTATPGSSVTLTLSALDDFPGRIATTATKSIAILHDTLPPTLTVVKPAAGEQFNEGSGATFAVEVNASDAEVAVKRVTVTFEGIESQLVLANGLWRATLNVPSVDGTDPVAKTLTIKAFDYEDNVESTDVAIAIKPLVDPNAPALSWVCASPGAMAPAGVAIPLRVSAIPSSGANGVQSVSIAIGNNAPVAAASAGTNLYQTTFTIPAGTADGTTFDVRVTALSVAGNESTLLSTITAVTGLTINTASTIAANDSAFENQSLIVTSGGTLTIVGPHRLRNLVVLDGGKVVQKHVDPYTADELQVDRLFVACNGSINVSALGISRNAGYPGFTAPDDASGGSHLGRGGSWVRTSAGAFGSIFEPKEPGSGGNHPGASVPVTEAVGGGMVRVRASGSVAVDGAIYAGGTWSPYGGGGGGSIWIATAGTLAGGGTLDATGASTTYGAGGGGAIALRYAVMSGALRPAANGGTSSQSRPGAAGTIAWNDDVVIDNKGTATASATELPSFGRAIVTNVASNIVTLDRRFVSPSFVGHRVRAAGGGTYRIAAIANDVATIDGSIAVLTQDAVAYDGWLLYSPQGVGIDRRKLVAVRRSGGTWQYDTDTSFSAFTPAAGDVIFATFSKDAQRITAVSPLACAATCGAIEGVAVAALIAGEIMPNAIMYTSPAGPNTLIGSRDAAEIFLRGDGQRRSLILARGAASTLTLQPLGSTTAMPQAGEVLRGVHQFNDLTLVSARVVTEDLVEVAGTLTKDASSTLSTGNADVPVIDPAKVTIARGRDGAVVVGAAGAVADPDSPLEIVATNANGTPLPRITLEDDNLVVSGTTGGLSVHHVESYRTGEGAGSLQSITASGYVAFSASAATNVQVGLAPAAATRAYNEPGHNSFRMKTNGTYEIWANAAFTGKSGSYDAATAFRIEKTPASLRWFVDNVEVHAVTSNVPASLLLHISFEQSATGEVTSIEYVTNGLPRDSYHAKVAADGSFRVPIAGTPGDAVRLRARDRHPYSLESSSVGAGVIPNDIGVASLTFDAPEMTGGRTAIGTITLAAPASSEGALVRLASNSSVVSLSETIVIAPGATASTFAIATSAVLSPVDVTIAATHGSIGPTAVLRVVRDNIAPVVTVSAPLSGTIVGEGPANTITVTATASDADSGVKRVYATFDGQTYDLTKGATTWTAQIPMPYIEGSADVTKDLVVTAVDNSDNSGSAAAVSIVIRPVVDGSVATVSWSCSSDGAMFPVNYDAPLRVRAVPPNATNVVQKVEIVVTDPSGLATTVPATPLGGDEYQYVLRVPDVTDGALYSLSARAVTAGGGVATVASSFTVLKGAVEIRANTTIGTTNTSYDNKAVVIWDGVTVTIDGAHTFQRLALLNGARIQHSNGSRFDATADALYVSCGASIDVSSRGYGLNETYPGAGLPGSYSSGSHIGFGGVNSLPRATSYGSVVRPAEAGGGGRFEGRGGGVVRIQAGTLTVDGTIRADGAGNTNTSSAGGSIWLTVTTLAGSGSITANGGTGITSGGGGAIAIDSTHAGGTVVSNLQAFGGTGSRPGSAGSVHLKSTGATFGNLTIDNTGRGQGTTELPSIGIGVAQAGSGGATLVIDRATDIPAYFEGHWIDVAGKGIWRIATITGKSVTLAPNANESIAIAPGDAWRGVHRFDVLRIRNSIVTSGDRIDFTTLDKDAGSTLIVNVGAPVLDAAKIAVVSTLAANEVVGAAGAVSDPDPPITLTVTNTRTAQTFTATATANGSFRVPIAGYPGDLFTIRATDSHSIPLSSPTQSVSGTIVELGEIQSLSIAPATVAAGTTVYGTLRLASPARTGGAVVSLASSSANATVPATVIVPGGASSVQFAIATTAPAIATDVTITATTGTNSKSATFTLTPSAAASLIDLALSSASVEGGASVNGTVLLGAPAPLGGAIVMLASTSPHAIVPETVVVPEGTTQASFTITTRQVGASTSLQITATWGTSFAANLQLTPCASMGAVTVPSSTTLATVWVDDAAPAGATASGEAAFDATRVAFGSASLHFAPPTATPIRTYAFTGAAALATTPNDRLALWALVNPCNPPRQILVTWSDGTTSYRVTWGESRIDPTASQIYAGAVPAGGAWTRLDVLTRALGFTANKNLTGLTISVDGGEVWFDGIGAAACSTATAARPAYLANEQVWFDDAFPPGAAVFECPAPNWNTTQVASGTAADLVTGNGSAFSQHCFSGATPPMTLAMDDVITVYVFLDPCNPPREIMLQLNYGKWDRRVYWGENLLDWDTVNSVQRRAMGPLPETGKWVRLEVPVSSMKLGGASLNGIAFTVNDGRAWFDRVGKVSRVNLASNKSAQQSSTYAGNTATYGPQRAADGDPSTINHTNSEANAYWQVDLGAVQPIEQIDVWRNTDCCPERSVKSYVLVSDVPFTSTNLATTLAQPGVTAYYHLVTFDTPSTFEINRTGRYVRVQLAGTNYLHLAEVQVWAPVTDETRVNISGGKATSQSSDYTNVNGAYIAALAVNGATLDQNLSHTNSDPEARWEVDLGAVEPISHVDLYNQNSSCCMGRMANAYLFVSDVPFAGTSVASALAQPGVSAYYRGPALSMRQFTIGRTGRYIRLQLTGTNYLHPIEVKVWSPTRTIAALAKPPFDFATASHNEAQGKNAR